MNQKEVKDALISIEKAFSEIKMKEDIDKNLRSVKMYLIKMGLDINSISITPSERDKFFGMCIYTDIKTAEKIVEAMASKKPENVYFELWENSKWNIEIDSKLLYDKDLNSNPREIVAALLHEIGHIVYSNSIPNKLHKVMSYSYLQLQSDIRIIVSKNNVFQSLFLPIVAQASSSRSYNVRKEMDADKYAAKLGYGRDLESLLNKILITYGSHFVTNNEEELENDLNVTAQWSSAQAVELRRRKRALRESITKINLQSPSKFINDVFDVINKKVFKGAPSFTDVISKKNRDKYHVESTMYMDDDKGIPCTTLVESTLKEKVTSKNGRIKKITQQDVDIIEIQIDKISTHGDKIYLLDVIYDSIEKIDLGLEYINNGNKDKVEMNERQLLTVKKQLEDARMRVINTKIKERGQYGVFIKYPAGYEG